MFRSQFKKEIFDR